MLGVMIFAAAATGCPNQQSALKGAAAAIESSYHDAEQGKRISSEVRRWATTGRYKADCHDEKAFLARLNRDLDAYDGHFHIERAAAEDSDDWLMSWRKSGRESAMGVRSVQILEGNTGYLRIASFYPWDLSEPRLRAAWSLLSDVDSLIIDLRQNGGGDAETAAHLVRALLGSSVESVQKVEERGASRPELLPQAALAPLRADLPVAILLDRRSASAAEFVGYSLQAAGRAMIVGQRSAGAASFIGEPVSIGQGLQIAVPNARPINLKTGGNWEGRGVSPDLAGGDDPVFVARAALASKQPAK